MEIVQVHSAKNHEVILYVIEDGSILPSRVLKALLYVEKVTRLSVLGSTKTNKSFSPKDVGVSLLFVIVRTSTKSYHC